jgi:hypothetical protein
MPPRIKQQPWHPAPYDDDVVRSIQSLATGTANENQQKTAIKWIVEQAAGTYDATYFADSEANTAFAEGKRHVGLQVVKLTKLVLKQGR